MATCAKHNGASIEQLLKNVESQIKPQVQLESAPMAHWQWQIDTSNVVEFQIIRKELRSEYEMLSFC